MFVYRTVPKNSICVITLVLVSRHIGEHNTPCLKKTVQISFCQNFVIFPPILIIFGKTIAKRLKLCELHSFSTSPNLCHHATVLNADVSNCYTTLKVVIFNKLFTT